MNRVRFIIKKVLFFRPWGKCSLFGEPDLTKDQLSEVGENELFLAQINLDTFRKYKHSPLLPRSGIISFFVKLDDMTGIVRFNESSHYNKSNCIRVDFNSDIDTPYDVTTGYRIHFVKNRKTKFQSGFLLETPRHEQLNEDEIILFEYYSKDCSYLSDTPCFLCYTITREDLLNRNYKNVKLVIIRDR
jgi:uncharacterized protein YwqG